MMLAFLRKVWVVVENPMNSMLWQISVMRTTLESMQAKRFVTYLGAFGGPSLKPLELYSTMPASKMVHIMRSQVEGRTRLALGGNKKVLAKRTGKWIGATGDLKESEEYPEEFAQAIAKLVSVVCVGAAASGSGSL